MLLRYLFNMWILALVSIYIYITEPIFLDIVYYFYFYFLLLLLYHFAVLINFVS